MCDVHGWLEFESSGAAEERRQDWGEASVRAVGGDEFGHLTGEAGAGIFGDDTALLVDEPHRRDATDAELYAKVVLPRPLLFMSRF